MVSTSNGLLGWVRRELVTVNTSQTQPQAPTPTDPAPVPQAQNQPPQVTGSVESFMLQLGAPPYSIELNTIFSDPEGQPLTFRAVSSDTVVALARLAGSQLQVHPGIAGGRSFISLMALDPAGATTPYRFAVTVQAPTSVVVSQPQPQQQEPASAQISNQSEPGGSGWLKWALIGGGLVAGGITAAVLAGGGGDGGSTGVTLAGPPPLPN
jgi:hypothetical protein